jgi:HTH-type transcriptional regulator / antitoxin HipB
MLANCPRLGVISRLFARTHEKRMQLDFAELIRERRKDLGLTQAEAAALAGVSPRFVFDVENGKPSVALDRLNLLLRALGLEIRIEVVGIDR